MKNRERVLRIHEVFEEIYPDVKCSLHYRTPLEMLIATQLSAQCTDARVNLVTKDLFEKYKNVDDFADADYETLMDDIRSIGFYRNKAKNIIACCQRLREVYGGRVPDSMEELLTLPGTGRKTANLVLGDIYRQPAIVVDTHCMRLSRRIGLTKHSEPAKIEMDLKKLIPPEYQLRMCHHFVHHGRMVCTARKPKCETCQIREYCGRVGV